MVHVRLNEKESNPNPFVNFITALPVGNADMEERSRQLLRAMAAQVKPIMKSHGFVVNSFEEYEYNKVFAGRNWNNGETVEVVLRGASGTYLPTSWLMSTFCHELAHIKHMNHGPAFQALWAKLRKEVKELQLKGYYGDGYWSSGRRLADSVVVSGEGLDVGDLPEFICGGAQTRKRPSSFRRRKTGVRSETTRKRKAGSRVTAQGVFKGDGRPLNADILDEEQKKAGSSFRKKAGSKRARDERASAAEKRIQALLDRQDIKPNLAHSSDSEGQEDEVQETDQDRRRIMLDSKQQTDLDSYFTSLNQFEDDFIIPPRSDSSATATAGSSKPRPSITNNQEIIEILSDDDNDDEDHQPSCDLYSVPVVGIAPTSGTKGKGREIGSDIQLSTIAPGRSTTNPNKSNNFKKRQRPSLEKDQSSPSILKYTTRSGSGSSIAELKPKTKRQKVEDGSIFPYGKKVEEATHSGSSTLSPSSFPSKIQAEIEKEESRSKRTNTSDEPEWICLVCTLSNQPGHLACSACATSKGDSTYRESA
ncbi:DNA-dependent metalloprotease WSS1-like protein [Abortiporus biennis]